MSERELGVRRIVMEGFARDGAPPEVEDRAYLTALAQRRVVVLDEGDQGRILMAHPFASPGAGTSVASGDRVWWGSCAWDGLGIVAALGLQDARLSSAGFELNLRDGRIVEADSLFHVAVPARVWWDDIAFT
jgi:hypothetical protein